LKDDSILVEILFSFQFKSRSVRSTGFLPLPRTGFLPVASHRLSAVASHRLSAVASHRRSGRNKGLLA
jgi:hypothetical protein